MPTYFGECDENGDPLAGEGSFGAAIGWRRNRTVVFTCPGEGNQTVKELAARVALASGSGNINIAIYSSDLNTKICEGAAELSITGASIAWHAYATQASITPNPATLVGGTNYVIAVTFDSATMNYGRISGTYGDSATGTDDYTGGWPTNLAAGSQASYLVGVRCGVDPEGEGATTTRNTRAWPLGERAGMGFRMQR